MTTNCRLREELEQARAELAAVTQPLRVPFTDEQIEKMAQAACDATELTALWKHTNCQDDWRAAIRAAVAAGGLEPYRPEDVALSTRLKRTTSRDLREIAIHAYLSNDQAKRENAGCMVDPMGDAVEAIRKALSDDNGLVEHIQGELKALSERLARVSAKSGRRRTAIKQLQKAHDGWRKLAEQRSERNKHLQQQAENRSKNYEELLKQRDILKIERDTFESAATKALDERDHRPTWEHLEKVKAEAEACDVARYAAEAQLDALHPGETVEGVVMERDHYRIQLEREQEWTKQYKADRDDALAELAAVKQERDRLDAATRRLSEESAAATCELAALRQRESVPVKVRWSVSDERIQTLIELGTFIRLDFDKISLLRETFAAHAVIDAPAGVPSVEDLRKIFWREDGISSLCEMREGALDSILAAIRDAMLAGVVWERESLVKALVEAKRQRDELASKLIAKNPSDPVYGGWHFEDGYKIVPNGEPSGNTGQFDEVEALARAIWKSYENLYCRSGVHMVSFEENRVAWLTQARAAFAHIGAPERPKGLPTVEGLAEMHYEHRRKNNKSWSVMSWVEHRQNHPDRHKEYIEATEHTITALAPFLREPVGWELDAPEGGWLSEGFCIHNPSTGETHSLDSFVSHVCSRIRPVYECKECAAWKTKYNESNQEINKALEAFGIAMPALSAARAALEGE